MSGSIVSDLGRCKDILKRIALHPDCSKITYYDRETVERFEKTIDRVILRYKKESERVGRYHK